MSITNSKGEKRNERSVSTAYTDQFHNSVAYQCLTKGHVWLEEPRPGSNELVCKRCGAIIDLGEEEDEGGVE